MDVGLDAKGRIAVSTALALAVAGRAARVCASLDQDRRAQARAQVQSSAQSGFVMKVNAELVLTNVVARDAKTGELVRGLKQSDFSVYENGKRQQIATF